MDLSPQTQARYILDVWCIQQDPCTRRELRGLKPTDASEVYWMCVYACGDCTCGGGGSAREDGAIAPLTRLLFPPLSRVYYRPLVLIGCASIRVQSATERALATTNALRSERSRRVQERCAIAMFRRAVERALGDVPTHRGASARRKAPRRCWRLSKGAEGFGGWGEGRLPRRGTAPRGRGDYRLC